MAQALLPNEPRTLQEFATLRESSILQDISLAEGDGGAIKETKEEVMTKVEDSEQEADTEQKNKSHSLKRFFRMPSKKKASEEGDPNNCEVELTEADTMHAEYSQRDLTGSFGRVNLKASISSYWNTVFKQKKNKKSNKSNENDPDKEPDLNENLKENEDTETIETKNPSVVDKILTEEIHSLKISDANDDK